MQHPEAGILPRVIRTLVERRREVKKLLKVEKDPVTAKQLDIRQVRGACSRVLRACEPCTGAGMRGSCAGALLRLDAVRPAFPRV
jgi:hypothetical protein